MTRKAELSPMEDAKRIAGRQLVLLGHAIVYVLACALVGVTAGAFPAVIVGLAWGIGLASHGFFAVAAPLMRRRLERHVLAQLEPPTVIRVEARDGRALEELSAAIAHEIRNPITAAKSLVQQIAEDPASTDNAEYAAVAVAELERVERSIVHLLRFARDEPIESTELRLADIVHSAVETLRDRAAKLGASVTMQLDDDGSMRGDPEKLRRVVVNLIGNALDAVDSAKPPEPRVAITSGASLAGDAVWVAVRDNGTGIPADALPRIFDPFYTSKEGGTGIGLALARKTVEAHGGTLEARNLPGGGAEFLFSVPRWRRTELPAPREGTS